MISRSLLLVLLALTCLQSFTTANNGNGLTMCCFKFVKITIPLGMIEKYTETERGCPKHGVVFTLKNKHRTRMCADPGYEWVQNCMRRIDQRLIADLNKTQTSA